MLNIHHPWSKPTVLVFVGEATCTTGMGVLAQRMTLLFPGLKFGTWFLSLNLIPHLWGYLQIQQNNKIMSRLGTLCFQVTWLRSQLMQSKDRACPHTSQCQYFTWRLSACRTLWHCHMSPISPSSAKDLFRCLSLSLWAGCPTTETRVSPVPCPWQGRDSNTQSLQEQSMCENEELQMLRKQIGKFALQECLPLFSLFGQLNKPFYGFSWKS